MRPKFEPVKSSTNERANLVEYTGGALGYLDFTGNMDTCIAIRMAVKQNGRVYAAGWRRHSGRQHSENEYEESANKAAAIINAIKNARWSCDFAHRQLR